MNVKELKKAIFKIFNYNDSILETDITILECHINNEDWFFADVEIKNHLLFLDDLEKLNVQSVNNQLRIVMSPKTYKEFRELYL